MVQRSHENMNLNKNKFKPRVNYADTAINCDTFFTTSFGTHNSSLANEKNYVLLYLFAWFCFALEAAISKDKPPGLIAARAILRRVFCVTSLRGF